MTTDFDKLRDVFLAALEQAPDQRDGYLEQLCAGDEDLRRKVVVMIQAHAASEGPLDRGALRDGPTTADDKSAEAPGTVIGPYKLIEPIGEGGMGTVWMAQQQEPVKRLVALKLIKPGMDSKQVIARFEAERQALALMDHPNIAKVLDGGTTAGRPYFVMDLVKGAPITRYCDEHHLTPRQRLELFVSVCQAVQHAHQKGIIHRDLKPSNVLVALYDGRPVPKVIDFGIAKATGQSLTDKTLVTGFGAIVGTLEYMSPEQAEINQLDIDTRSDIYSLGVLLYELLTGSPPFTRKELQEAGLLEMLRVIREQEPSKPSTKLSSAEGLPTLAANRGTEPAKLTRQVRGELDWIVMKALDKDRNRRYESANGFARDVGRYLADEAVLACPPSAAYRFKKFARRNWRVLATLAATVAVLLLAVVGLAVGVVRVGHEQERAQAANRQLKGNLRLAIRALDEIYLEAVESRYRHHTQRRDQDQISLQKVLAFYEQFAEENSTDPEVRYETGRAYGRAGRIQLALGELAKARASLERSIEVLGELLDQFGHDPEWQAELATAHNDLGLTHQAQGRAGDAERELREAIRQRRRVAEETGAPKHRFFAAASLTNLGVLLQEVGRFEEALRTQEAAAALWGQPETFDPQRPLNLEAWSAWARCRNNLGLLLWTIGRHDKSEQVWNETLQVAKRVAKSSPDVVLYQESLARAHGNYGLILQEVGKYALAEEALTEAIRGFDGLAKKYPQVREYRHHGAKARINLGLVMQRTNRPHLAVTMLQQAAEALRKLADAHPGAPEYRADLALARLNRGTALMARRRFAEAEQDFQQALALCSALTRQGPRVPSHRRDLALSHAGLGGALVALGKAGAAEKPFREAIRLQAELVAELPRVGVYADELARSHFELGNLLANANRPKEAEGAYRAAIRIRPAQSGPHFNLGIVLMEQKRPAEAEAASREVVRLAPSFAPAHYELGRALLSQGKASAAAASFKEALRLDPNHQEAREKLALALTHQGPATRKPSDGKR